MTPTAHRTRTATTVVALLAAAALAGPPTVSAATVPTVNGTTLTLTGDDAADRVVVGEDAGQITVTVNGAPLNLGAAVPADNTIDLLSNSGGGDDELTITTANLKSVTADGGAGDDILTGNNDADTLSGGDGDDRVIGARGGDTMNGGNGNDTLVWNNGDGSDTMNGDGNTDEIEVNGAVTQGDSFTVKPNPADPARTRFDRINLVPFNLNIDAERITVNGLGGDDIMAGGDGDDTTVWNNGDGSDKMDGDAGIDRVEVNGAGAGDAFTIAPNGARAKFDRTNLVPFTLDVSAEALDLRALAGDDTFAAAAGTGALLAVTADGGSGNDTLNGADEADTFAGGSGNDALTGGAGPDSLDGQ